MSDYETRATMDSEARLITARAAEIEARAKLSDAEIETRAPDMAEARLGW